jgi:Protein of unknown function (DUF3040)
LGLNAHDRQALAQIEEALADADPKFAAQLSSFSRLVDGEPVLERERIRDGRRPAAGQSICGLSPERPRAFRLLYVVAAAMALALTITMIVIVLISRTSGKGTCAQWTAGTCVKQAATSPPKKQSQQSDVPSLTP